MAEATAVEPAGRISEADTGLWNRKQAEAFERIAAFSKKYGAAFGIQICHAGRKAWTGTKGQGPQNPLAPSAVPMDDGWEDSREQLRENRLSAYGKDLGNLSLCLALTACNPVAQFNRPDHVVIYIRWSTAIRQMEQPWRPRSKAGWIPQDSLTLIEDGYPGSNLMRPRPGDLRDPGHVRRLILLQP